MVVRRYIQSPGIYRIEAESGTGKSSMCSFIYGNRSDYRGRILFNGRDIRSFSVKEWCDMRVSHIALLPQEMRLFPELTVTENIEIKNRLTSFKTRDEITAMLGAWRLPIRPMNRQRVCQSVSNSVWLS